MNNKVVITIISVLAIVAFLFFAYKFTNTEAPTSFPKVSTITANDHVTWSPEKKHILVEYGDFQCPACKSYHDVIKTQIEKTDIPKKITFVYRNYPLVNVHEHAEDAAYAAEAAGLQGKYFEYADVLYNSQPSWEAKADAKDYFSQIAKNLKLDMKKFEKDRNSKEVKDKVAMDVATGNEFNVTATPTFYLDGEKLNDIGSFSDFEEALSSVK